MICILFFIHIFDLSLHTAQLSEPDAHLLKSQVERWKSKPKRKNCFTFRPSVYRPHVSSHLSLVYIHTMTLPLSVGTRCHHSPASEGLLGARWVSPRYLGGAALGLTDRLTATRRHTCTQSIPFLQTALPPPTAQLLTFSQGTPHFA